MTYFMWKRNSSTFKTVESLVKPDTSEIKTQPYKFVDNGVKLSSSSLFKSNENEQERTGTEKNRKEAERRFVTFLLKLSISK